MTENENKDGTAKPFYEAAGSADGWTVRAEDYDKLADAARMLASACKHRLPPGFFAEVEKEFRAVRELLSPPNVRTELPARVTPVTQDNPKI